MRRAGRDAAFTPIEIVITGLDPVIHLRKNLLRRLMDARIKSGHDGCVSWGEANERFAHTTTSQFSNSKNKSKHASATPPRDAPESCVYLSPTASRPYVPDDHDTPLLRGGMRKVLEVIWGVRKPKYFCKGGWTSLSTNRPTGKSLEPVLLSALSVFARVPDTVQRALRRACP